jgi:beta-aspartyl-peptidase (threonine type)
MIEFAGMDVAAADDDMVFNRMKALGGTGGVIALDREGNFAAPFSTPGMFHGYLTADGTIVV